MKKYYVVFKITFILILLFSACKKENDQPQPAEKGHKKRARPESARDGKYDLLGYGYDVTGEFANASAAKYAVINIDALQKAQPSRVEIDLSNKQFGNLISASDAVAYLTKRSQKVEGGFGFKLFKASITTKFSNATFDSTAVDAKHVYASYDLIIQLKRVKNSGSVNLLKKYLDPSFQYDIEEESPAYIVQSYGTHVLTDIILGAKLQIYYQSETYHSDRLRQSEAGIAVSAAEAFHLNVGVQYSANDIKNDTLKKFNFMTIGGDGASQLIGEIQFDNKPPFFDIKPWQSSVNVNNAELIHFNPETLIPIYEFISDSAKKEAVKAYVYQYLKDNELQLKDLDPPYLSWSLMETSVIPGINFEKKGIYIVHFQDKFRQTKRVKSLQVNYRFYTDVYLAGEYKGRTYGAAESATVTNDVSLSLGERIADKATGMGMIRTKTGFEILPGNYTIR